MPITNDWPPNGDGANPAGSPDPAADPSLVSQAGQGQPGQAGQGPAPPRRVLTLSEAALWLGLAQVARQAASVMRQHAPRSALWIGLRRAALLSANLIEQSLTEEDAVLSP